MKTILYIILFPFSIIYGTILFIRNLCYDWNLFKTTSFDFPVIVVGNLNIGGVGKTPHVEYIIRLLSKKNKVATLSRGYKRNTSGYILANYQSSISDIGDEPLQYKKKFKNTPVAVDENRVRGIQNLKNQHSELNCIILDDAFQHRSVNAGINILVTDYNNLYINDSVLPGGRLREWKSGMKRAQIIIVSKCPTNLSSAKQKEIISQITPKPYQQIYFSTIKYGEYIPVNNLSKKITSKILDIDSALIITGISNPYPFLNEINSKFKKTKHIDFPDHHQFSKTDIKKIKKEYDKFVGNSKIVITTEKDYMRLSSPEILDELDEIPIFYLPIEITFLGKSKEEFDHQLINYTTANSGN